MSRIIVFWSNGEIKMSKIIVFTLKLVNKIPIKPEITRKICEVKMPRQFLA